MTEPEVLDKITVLCGEQHLTFSLTWTSWTVGAPWRASAGPLAAPPLHVATGADRAAVLAELLGELLIEHVRGFLVSTAYSVLSEAGDEVFDPSEPSAHQGDILEALLACLQAMAGEES